MLFEKRKKTVEDPNLRPDREDGGHRELVKRLSVRLGEYVREDVIPVLQQELAEAKNPEEIAKLRADLDACRAKVDELSGAVVASGELKWFRDLVEQHPKIPNFLDDPYRVLKLYYNKNRRYIWSAVAAVALTVGGAVFLTYRAFNQTNPVRVVQDLTARVSTLEVQNTELNKANQEFRKGYFAREKARNAELAKMAKSIATLDDEARGLMRQVEGIEATITQSSYDICNISYDLDTLNGSFNNYTQTAAESESYQNGQIGAANAQITDLQGCVNDVFGQLADAKDANKAIDDDAKRIRREIVLLRADIDSKMSENPSSVPNSLRLNWGRYDAESMHIEIPSSKDIESYKLER